MNKIYFISLFFCTLFLCTSPTLANKNFYLTVGNLPDNSVAPLYSISKKLGGNNTSPDVKWTNPPKKTKSFVLTCIDKNPVANNWVHWMILNIPPTYRNIPKGIRYDYLVKKLCIVAKNSFGNIGYGGPQPPPNTGYHNYVFTIYALDCRLKNIKPYSELSEKDLLKEIKDHIIKKAQLTLRYK